MTKSLEEKVGLPAPDAKVLRDIQRVGWHVTGVFAQQDEKGPEWAFSVGLFHSFQHPEVVVFGLPFQRCMDIVNVMGQEVQAGKRYEPGAEYADILQDPYRCVFREVDRQHYSDYVGYALWFYEEDPFPRSGTVRASSEVMSGILNCVCPDCGGSMGGAGKEFKCRGECQTDWRRLWEQVLSAGFNGRPRGRSH